MTPEEMESRLITLTAAHNSLDQDVQDLEVLRKHDAQLLRIVRTDLADFRTDVKEEFAEVKAGIAALTSMMQTLIDRDTK